MRLIPFWLDELFDIFRSREGRIGAKARRFVAKNPEAAKRYVEEFDWDRWAEEYNKALSSAGEMDLSAVARQIRQKLGWPSSGPIDGLLLADTEVGWAVRCIESKNGKLPAREAVKIIAVLDADGSEARYVAYRKSKGLPI